MAGIIDDHLLCGFECKMYNGTLYLTMVGWEGIGQKTAISYHTLEQILRTMEPLQVYIDGYSFP